MVSVMYEKSCIELLNAGNFKIIYSIFLIFCNRYEQTANLSLVRISQIFLLIRRKFSASNIINTWQKSFLLWLHYKRIFSQNYLTLIQIITSRSRQNCGHSSGNIFKLLSLDWKSYFYYDLIAFFPKFAIKSTPVSGEIMDSRRLGDKILSEPMVA